MKSATDCLRFEKESFGALHTMLAGLDQSGKDAAWREIESELRKFETTSGFEGPYELIVIAGSASPAYQFPRIQGSARSYEGLLDSLTSRNSPQRSPH
jgi:hypothetical protein